MATPSTTTRPLHIGDVVMHEDSRGLCGVIRSIDAVAGCAVVAWYPTTTTEQLDDLVIADQ
jgi:hypothetical protein